MKKITLLGLLLSSTCALANTAPLATFLRDNLSEGQMSAQGRVGEVSFTVTTRALNTEGSRKQQLTNAMNEEVLKMAKEGEIFRHEGVIDSLSSLISNGAYEVIYKTGHSKRSPNYSSDGIKKDLLGMLEGSKRRELEKNLNLNGSHGSDLVYLRTFTTASEYDGMEIILIAPRKTSEAVVVKIYNCGGC